MDRITQEKLKNIVKYEPETGNFTSCEGNKITSYVHIIIDGKHYRAHQLAWFYMNGEWPNGFIDHIDGNGLNNKLSNLRKATNQQNQFNQRKRKDNKSGHKGVGWYKRNNKWNARLRFNKKMINLGYFDTKEEAAKAYNEAALKYFGEFARLNEI